jgi:transcriptional regulator PpsR
MNKGLPPSPGLEGLSEWAPELAQTFVSLASDVALVLDDNGVIRSIAQGPSTPVSKAAQGWIGQAWADTVTGETRGKIEQMLKEVSSTGLARRREINHPSDTGGCIAMAYTAIRLGQNGPLLAVGRDLSAVAAIQQRFLATQQEMERGYWQARQAEARYRLLFQVATDAVLVVDVETLQIVKSNQAASQMFDMAADQLVGRMASFGFERHSRRMVDDLLATARSSAQPSEIRARLLGKITATSVSATQIRSDDAVRILVRVRSMSLPGASADLSATLARLVDGASDGVVVTDSTGRIQIANPAFLKIARMSTEADVKGRALMDWVGVSDEQFASLLSQVRRQGITGRIASHLLARDARVNRIELSAALLTEGDQECIGFTIHQVIQEHDPLADSAGDFRLAFEKLSGQIGSVPLPELLSLASAVMERHFVSVAMNQSGGDASAAAILLSGNRENMAFSKQGTHGFRPEST